MKNYLLRGAFFLFSFFAFSFSWSASAHADLIPFWQDNGKISVSVDANGNNNPEGGTISVEKPIGGTVRKAFLMAASFGGRVINNGDIILDGSPIEWDKTLFNGIANINDQFFNNTLADVTSLLKDKINDAAPGTIEISVKEINTTTIDGEILVVVFDDPNQVKENGIILLFGKQSTLGDSFVINLSNTINVNDPSEIAQAGLGISFGYQNTVNPVQYSLVDVNGIRLSSSAGGEDDGISANGGLITVGGIGDSDGNPSPFSPPKDMRTDDELYNLIPYMNSDDKSILFSTINPSNDDNIFFAYFATSVPAAVLPPLDPPGARYLRTSDLIGLIDPKKPTIVLTHGLQPGPYDDSDRATIWTSFAENRAGDLLYSQLGTDVNILQYTWEEAFHDSGLTGESYIKARKKVPDAAANLAKRLFEELGPEYSQPVHFIGHSLGTAVNAYAARAFFNIEPEIKEAQVTILDYPNKIDQLSGMNSKEADIWGFDENFFASVLPLNIVGLEIKVDNYFVDPDSWSQTGVGTAINGPVYNHEGLVDSNDIGDTIFDNESFFNNDHSGVHQWYRWTIDPRLFDLWRVCHSVTGDLMNLPFFFDDSLDPCKKGWQWSILNPDQLKFPNNNGGSIKTTALQPLIIENYTDYGCNFDGSLLACDEQSSPFGIGDINIPENVSYMSFNYIFTNSGDGDYAAVFIDDVPVWMMSGQSAIEGLEMNSGPIPIRGFAAGQHKITIALYGVGDKNAEVKLSDFMVFSVEAYQNNPPTANAGTDFTAYLNDLVTLDGSGSFDPDDDPLTHFWTQTDGPVVSLNGEDTVNLTFTPEKVGTYTFTLTVSDGELTALDSVSISVMYKFDGFSPPIKNPPSWNTGKAGRVIPIKFSLDGDQGMGIFDGNFPLSEEVSCSDIIGVGIPEDTATAGNSGLNYDPLTNMYNYIWKTDKNWSGTCRQLTVKLIDGTSHSALFKLK